MSQTFRLFWLRESACDAGTVLQAAALDRSIRDRVLELTGGEPGEFTLRLPFCDRREWRKRSALLPQIPLERTGDLIRCVLTPSALTRDLAATLVLTHPLWRATPAPHRAEYKTTWQHVSLALQRGLRSWIAEEFLRDPARCEDRHLGYTLAVYQASRPFQGRNRARGEFCYDLEAYPSSAAVLEDAWKLTGRATQFALQAMERKLEAAGLAELARRYAPVWYEDVHIAVEKKPSRFASLLSVDSAVINAVVDLAVSPNAAAINRSARLINRALRNVLGVDMRSIGELALEETTRVLTQIQTGRVQNLDGIRPIEDSDVTPSGSPDQRIGDQEDGQHRSPDGSGQMSDAGVVADIQARGSQPTSQFV